MAKCRVCKGSGKVIRTVCGYPSYRATCSECHGTGRDSSERCPTCNGSGHVWEMVCGYQSYLKKCPRCHGTGIH